MFIVYILQSLKDGKTYTGYTNNLKRRLDQHNNGLVKATKHRTPFKLLLKEQYGILTQAKKRELWWKSGAGSAAGRRKLKELFNKK